jgi:hypothetical protein
MCVGPAPNSEVFRFAVAAIAARGARRRPGDHMPGSTGCGTAHAAREVYALRPTLFLCLAARASFKICSEIDFQRNDAVGPRDQIAGC